MLNTKKYQLREAKNEDNFAIANKESPAVRSKVTEGVFSERTIFE